MDDDIELARRKERLIASVAAQRASFAAAVRDVHGPIAVADRTIAVVHFLRAHPVLIVAVVAALVVFRRHSMVGLITRGFTAWRVWRSLGTWAGRMGLIMRRARGS